MATISWSISKHEQLHLYSEVTETRFIKASILSDSFYGLHKFTILADNAPLTITGSGINLSSFVLISH